MNQYMTALLLLCATLMGQGQPAQLNVRMLDTRTRQELCQQVSVQPLLRAQLRMLGSVELHSLLQAAGHALLLADQPALAEPGAPPADYALDHGQPRWLAQASARPRAP